MSMAILPYEEKRREGDGGKREMEESGSVGYVGKLEGVWDLVESGRE